MLKIEKGGKKGANFPRTVYLPFLFSSYLIAVLYALNSKRDKRIYTVATDSNAGVYIVKTDTIYESFLIFGQRGNLNIFDLVNTHNNDDFTMLRLGGAVIGYEKSNNGALILKIPEYASACIISGNDLSFSLN